ncbi:MAG: Holliday junction resolvase RuvX [Candidatus Edwardsbacteria bacterium]
MARILALDLGRRRVGVAISDFLKCTAQGLSTLEIRGKRDLLNNLKKLMAEYEIEEILVGMPFPSNGQLSKRGEEISTLVNWLQKQISVPFRFWDETFTTKIAEQILHESGLHLRGRKGALDKISAILMLQEYLSQKNQK